MTVAPAPPTLAEILTVEPAHDEHGAPVGDTFVGLSPPERRARVFGGQVVAQALVAATQTTPATHHVHSLHAYFLRGGDVDQPIHYEVDRLRDGRSFTARRVTASQEGKAILVLSASFHAAGIAYATDHGPFGAARRIVDTAGAGLFDRMFRASLDHAIWFHRPPRIDEWVLYDIEAITHRDDRILTSGRILDAAGRRIATVAQEILARAPQPG